MGLQGVPGRVPEGLREMILVALLQEGLTARKGKNIKYFFIFEVVLSAFLCVSFAFPAAPAQERTFKILVFV